MDLPVSGSTLRTGLLVAVLLTTLGNTAMILTLDRGGGGTVTQEPFALPTGSPSYAETLGVSFDAVSSDSPQEAEEVIRTLAAEESRELTAAERARYIDILYEMDGGISCEYCCEAESIITADGRSGCGCSHAAAMRGLTKTLLQETDMTDETIAAEVGKWKVRFFPQQSRAKHAALQERGVEPTFINLATNQYRGASSGDGWVGDC